MYVLPLFVVRWHVFCVCSVRPFAGWSALSVLSASLLLQHSNCTITEIIINGCRSLPGQLFLGAALEVKRLTAIRAIPCD